MVNWDIERVAISADLMVQRSLQKGRQGQILLNMAQMLNSLKKEQKKQPKNEIGQPPENESGQPQVTTPTRTRETILQESPNRLTRRQLSILMEEETCARPQPTLMEKAQWLQLSALRGS